MEALGIAALLAPILLAYLLRPTRIWWLPGVLPWAGAVFLYSKRNLDHPGDVGGIGAMANSILVLGALGLVLYGVVLLVTTYLVRRARRAEDRKLGF